METRRQDSNIISHQFRGERERERARNARIATHVSAYDRSDPEKTLRGIAFNYMT